MPEFQIMKDQIVRLLDQKDYVPANVPELLRLLRLPPNRQQLLQGALRELEQTGRVARIKGNRYIQPREADLIPGRIRMNRQGKGFLQPDDAGLKEIAIPEGGTGTALHEDRVLVRRDVRPKGLRSGAAEPDTGAVVRILERRRTQMVGTLQRGRRFLYVIPDDPRIPHDIYVPEPRDLGRPARIGDKVVVELREWESRHTNPEGEIVEVLGAPGEEGVRSEERRVGKVTGVQTCALPIFPRASATRWWSSCANGNRATRIRKARSSKSSVRRVRKAWTCSRCCANTICRCIFPKPSCTRRTPSARRFTRATGRVAWIAAVTGSSRLIPTTQKISTMPSVWSMFRRSNGGCWSTLRR